MRDLNELFNRLNKNYKELNILARAAEAASTPTPELVKLLKELQVGLIKVPSIIGGYQLSLRDQLRYFEKLAYANPTAGWVGFNHAGVGASCGSRLPDQGVEFVFGGNQEPLLSGIINPTGYYKEVDGGFKVTGAYPYASGVKHADWVMLPAKNISNSKEIRKFLFSREQINLTGSWDVMSLRGTGSFTVEVNESFVPQHFCLSQNPLRGGAMYSIALKAFVASELLGFTLGVCQRFLDELKILARKKNIRDQGLLSERGAFQFELGKGELELESIRAFGEKRLYEADLLCEKNSSVSEDEELKISSMLSYGVDHSVQVINRLFQFAGAGALFNSQILQRCFRDAQGARQHHNSSNYAYELYGKKLLT